MDDDSYARIRADFESLKAKLKASADQLDPERYDQITARLVALDGAAIRERISQRRGSHRIGVLMTDIEQRLIAAEEGDRGRT